MSSENQNAPKPNPALSAVFRSLSRSLAVRGVLEIVFGVLLLLYTDPTIRILTIVIGAALILSGVAQLLGAARSKNSKKHWALINAIALVVFGVLIICSPLLWKYLWSVVLGLWLIVSSVNEFFGGGWRRFWGFFCSVLTLAVGVAFIAFPFVCQDILAKVTGGLMITSGVLALCAGVDLHVASKKV